MLKLSGRQAQDSSGILGICRNYPFDQTQNSSIIGFFVMPELPEVETIRIGLAKYLPGKLVKSISCDWPKSLQANKADIKKNLIGRKIKSIDRRGKVLIIWLDNNWAMVIHLKMTGQLVYRPKPSSRPGLKDSKASSQKSPSALLRTNPFQGFGGGHPTNSLISKLPDRSTRVIIVFDKGSLYFNDQRKFGWIKLLPKDKVYQLDFFRKLGPEPLSKDFSYEVFKQSILKRPNSMIKPVIMDQSIIAGIGNIYADESLFLAKIHPSSRVKDISTQKFKALYNSIKKSLKIAIKHGGSTDRNYVNVKGQKGSYLEYAQVFRKENQPCPVCAGLIKKIRVASRGTYFCPKCQKLARKKK
ncbi:MAG: bifunctional DNA-formamidopyrimidine glycosylase/DNA-(apurinic or apyrimidinic site) lyase [bacterium]|nr:bifunctional DNA-formamidopyrimidine glycosylase/DNA-(apurinic or apyrimidinic site) lyase [bacterium]